MAMTMTVMIIFLMTHVWTLSGKRTRWYSSHRPINISRKFLGVPESATATNVCWCSPTSHIVHAKLNSSSGTGNSDSGWRKQSLIVHETSRCVSWRQGCRSPLSCLCKIQCQDSNSNGEPQQNLRVPVSTMTTWHLSYFWTDIPAIIPRYTSVTWPTAQL